MATPPKKEGGNFRQFNKCMGNNTKKSIQPQKKDNI